MRKHLASAFLALALCAGPASAAITARDAGQKIEPSSVTQTTLLYNNLGTPCPIGDWIVGVGSSAEATAGNVTLDDGAGNANVDSVGNAYTSVTSALGSFHQVIFYSQVTVAAGTTTQLRFTYAGVGKIDTVAACMHNVGAFEKQGTGQAATTATATSANPSITPTAASTVVIGWLWINPGSSDALTPTGDTFTNLTSATNTGNNILHWAYRLVNPSTLTTYGNSWVATRSMAANTMTFTEAGAAAAVCSLTTTGAC